MVSSNFGTRDVFSLDTSCFLLLDVDTSVDFSSLLSLFGLSDVLGNLNFTLSVGVCLTDCTITLSVGNVYESLVDRTSSSLLTDAVDVVGLVSNIDDVDVDEVET